MSRQQFVYIPEESLFSRNTSECHEVRKLLLEQLFLEIRVGQERLDLGSKQERAVLMVIIKRFDPEMVSCAEQCLLLSVKDDKRKHSSQFFKQSFLAPLFVSVEKDLRIGMCCKYMSGLNQLFSDPLIVVKLAVKDQHQIFVFIEHRLRPAFQVDNTKSDKAQSNSALHEGIL